MNIGTCFWFLMLLWLIFGLAVTFGAVTWPYAHFISDLLLWVLFALIGWKVFGPMLKS